MEEGEESEEGAGPEGGAKLPSITPDVGARVHAITKEWSFGEKAAKVPSG